MLYRLPKLIFGLFSILTAAALAADPSLPSSLPSSPVKYVLGTHAGAGDIQAAIASNEWHAASAAISLTPDEQTVWLRLAVPPGKQTLLLTSTWLRDFDVYFVAGTRVLTQYQSGTNQPVAKRPIAHPQFAYPVPPHPSNQHLQAYLHHQSSVQSARYPLEFHTAAEFSRATTWLHLSHGVFYGIFFVLLCYNLAVYWAVRDRSYLYFVLYNLGLVGFLAGSDGFAQFYLWPDHPNFNLLTPMWLGLSMLTLPQFIQHFFHIRNTDGIWLWLIRGVQVATVVILALALVVGIPSSTAWVSAVVVIETVLLFCLLVRYARQGSASAWGFVLGNGAVAVAAIYCAFVVLGYVSYQANYFEWAFAAVAIELIIISTLLAARLRRFREETQRAKMQTVDLSSQVQRLQESTQMHEEHQELQRSVQQSQKLKSIGQLTGGVAHDFNNILASILGFTELALDKTAAASRSDQVRYLQEIQAAGERGAELVKQLLIYSRNGNKEARDVNLNNAVQQAGQLLRGSLPASVIINAHLQSDEITCRLDPILLQQTLVNLALNASEAMKNRGVIDITLAKRSVADQVCSSCLERFSGDYAVIKVEDNGPGLVGPPADLFNPFVTSKMVGEGSGLGLSVVHGIVHEHHGHVQLSNRAPTGTRAAIFIPKTSISQLTPTTLPQILLVVEDASVRSYLGELLTSQGYDVTAETQPADALAVFNTNPHAFDLVVTDHLMTQQTGLELAARFHKMRPELPIALTTGHPNGLEDSDLSRSGIRAVFEKPIKAHLLLAKVKGLLRS